MSRKQHNINILTSGLEGYKSRSIVLPLLRYQDQLQYEGINIDILYNVDDKIESCDILLIQKSAVEEFPEFDIDDMRELSESVGKLLYFDAGDSTGGISTDVLPVVDGYYKKQLLKDRSKYLEPMYSKRIFSEYYNDEFGIEDDHHDGPEAPVQVENEHHLNKLGVYWNYGFEPHIPYVGMAGNVIRRLPDELHQWFQWETLYSRSLVWPSPERKRPIDVSGRFSTEYEADTVAFQRKLTEEKLGDRLDTEKVGKWRYWRELRQAKVLISPFGWGEICGRDFEGFMSGCLVIKPHMEHLETWPPVYEEGETYFGVDWDLSDLPKTVDRALKNYEETVGVAKEGQRRYREYIVGESAADRFVGRFKRKILEKQ